MFMSYLLTGLCSAVFSLYMHGETISAGASGLSSDFTVYSSPSCSSIASQRNNESIIDQYLAFVGYNLVYGMKAGLITPHILADY